MQTDRELLELAAKVYGFFPNCWTESEYPVGSNLRGALWNYKGHMSDAELWNPLSNDGDALRLAMKLNMSVDIEEYESSTYAYVGKSPREYACENWGADKAAATRRAIVRAAAETEKEMK
jgi:hypothetical protein